MDAKIEVIVFAVFLVVMGFFSLIPHAQGASESEYLETRLLVEAADHEAVEGYFHVGEYYIVVKPGSKLHQFLVEQKGHYVVLEFTEQKLEKIEK